MAKEKESQLKRKSLEYFRTLRREIVRTKWPGTDKDVGVLNLTVSELQEAFAAAYEWFDKRQIKIDEQTRGDFDSQINLQIIYRALLDPDSNRPQDKIFTSAKEAREKLYIEELEYFAIQIKNNTMLKANSWSGFEPDKPEDNGNS